MKELEELGVLYQRLTPAKATVEFMKEQRDFNKKVELTMNDMKHDIKDLSSAIRESTEQNRCEHKEIMGRIGRIEQFVIGILLIFAMATLYFIFSKVGLPTP